LICDIHEGLKFQPKPASENVYFIKIIQHKLEESIFSVGDTHPVGRPLSGFGEEGNMIIYFKETRDLFLGINLGNKLLRDISTTK